MGGSGGIGAAVAESLASLGASLIIHGGSSREGLDASLARALRAGSPSVEGFLLPLTRPLDLVGKLPGLGTIDILACAFGPFVQASIHETSPEDWERLALLDLALPGALASALLPGMLKRSWGRFLFFGGTRTDAIRAYSANAAYASAKTGLGVLVKSLAAEYSGQGIGAFLLCPGLVETEYLPPGLKASLKAKAPGGRLLDPEDLARFGAGLVAADPPIASGAIVNLDAGLKL